MPTLRPLQHDDIPAHAALLAAAEAVDRTGRHTDEDDLVEEYADPVIELGRDVVGAFDGDELVGYFAVYPRPSEAGLTVHLDGTVLPGRRGEGVGTLLATAMLARADEVHAERHPDRPARFVSEGITDAAAQEQLLAAHGLLPHRWSFSMRTALAQLPVDDAPVGLPAGHTLLTWTPALDGALRAAHNEVFLDHPGFTPWSETAWAHQVDGRHFRPDLACLLVADDAPERVVAYLQTSEYDAYFAATGRREAHVNRVGTRRELRGHGVAGALLRESLRRFRDAGYDEASLEVDSANPTGALGVYVRAGFEIERRWTVYVVERAPLDSPAFPPTPAH